MDDPIKKKFNELGKIFSKLENRNPHKAYFVRFSLWEGVIMLVILAVILGPSRH